MAERYVGMFDMLGFKSLIETTPLDNIVRRAKRFVSTARDVLQVPGKDCAQRLSVLVFQDTIIVTSSGTSARDFECIVKYASALIGFGFYEGFMIRGAIVRGEVHVDEQMVIGKAIVQAYQMEQNQDWMGCWLEDSCVAQVSKRTVRELEKWLILRYFVPLKTGLRRKGWALNWTVPLIATESRSLEAAWNHVWKPACEDGRVSWDVRRKLEQTDRFLSQLLRMGRLRPNKEITQPKTKASIED